MRKSRKIKDKIYQLKIETLSAEGRGIAHFEDKVIFVHGALPGEQVIAKRAFSRAKFEEAETIEVLNPSPHRISPKCQVFGICGGCSLQYLTAQEQINIKTKWLKNALMQQANIAPKYFLQPLLGQSWGYRYKARLGVRYVDKKAKVLVGFRERKSSFITDMSRCEVLPPMLGEHLDTLAQCIERLSIKNFVPQIEVAIADKQSVLVLRHLRPLTQTDEQILADCSTQLGFVWYLQSGGLDTLKPLNEACVLTYSLPQHNIEMTFLPTDFTQVNFALNQKMVNLALQLLQLKNTDKVIDFFCGLGNFTLPMARYAKEVVGVEGDKGLIQRAQQNAENNQIENVSFFKADLFQDVGGYACFRGKTYNKALIDPPRSGAAEVVELLAKLGVERLVYVSCKPTTFARDTKRLLALGYQLEAAGVMDMFPQTDHIECIALFIKNQQK